MAAQRRKRRGFVLSAVGLVLVIVGVIWMTVIFPALDKVPTSYERNYYFVGNFTVVNPATQTQDFFPIEQILAQKANGTKDGALLIHEKRTVLRTDTTPATDISSYGYGDESTLAINAHTLQFMPNVDERHRTGSWGPPRGLGENKNSFDLWNEGANEPLTARYVRTEDFRGMNVVLFRIDVGNITLPGAENQPPLYYKTIINLWIDPRSGTVVDQDSNTITSLGPQFGNIPVQISNVRYDERTIVDLMDVASDAAQMLLLFTVVIPWVLIGVGAILVVIDTVLIWRRRASGT